MSHFFILAFIIILSFFNITEAQSCLGKVHSRVAFREGPGKEYTATQTFYAERVVYIFSMKTINDYYKILDIETNKEGYIHKDYVNPGEIVESNNSGLFTPIGKSVSDQSELKIYNNTSRELTLRINSSIFSFKPNEKKSIWVPPGKLEYLASAPGVIPSKGYEAFEGGVLYSWEFYIETRSY